MCRHFFICFSALLASLACKNHRSDDVPRAQTEPATDAARPAPVPAAGVSTIYTINNTNSKIEFVGSNVTESHEGTFDSFSGLLQLVDRDPTRSSARIAIEMTSVSVRIPQLQEHLRSADFFDARHFPQATFESSTIERAGGDRYRITGNLTLRGITRIVTFPTTIIQNTSTVSVQAEFSINRKEFGIEYPGLPDDLIKDDVLIRLKLNARSA